MDVEHSLLRKFKALANRRRLEIFYLLLKYKEGMPVTDIAEKIDLSVKSTSKHLWQMHQAGILKRFERANLVYYSVDATDKDLIDYLKKK